MNSYILKVAKFEIVRQLKKPAFWAATLLLPLLIGGIYFISFISSQSVETNPTIDEDTKIAITDDAGVFSKDAPYIINGDKEYGIEMVKKGEVKDYFYIPPDFLETRKAEFYHISEGLDIFNMDGNLLKMLLLQDASTRVEPRDVMALTGGFEVADNKMTKNGEESNALGKAIIPFLIGVLFFMFVALCGNRFLLSVVEEKENRISEMILTSISAKHLIIGKIISMLALGLVQIIVLLVPVLIIVLVGRENQLVGPILEIIEIDPLTLTLAILLFVASSVLYAGCCTFVGSLVSTAKDASSFIGPAIIGMVLPLYFMQMFMASEPSMIVQFLTYFPLTAPISLFLRLGFGTISTVEFVIGLVIVMVFAVVAIKVAAKSFQKNAINFGIAKINFGRKKSAKR